MLSPALKRRIRALAERYETPDFLMGDPGRFMHRYDEAGDKEIVAFFAACLAFGKRSEILSHIESLLGMMLGTSPSEWLLSGQYSKDLPDSPASFYRIFSYRCLRLAGKTLAGILAAHGTLGNLLKEEYFKGECLSSINAKTLECKRHPGRLATLLASHFPDECSPLVPKGEQSANKRLNLFLRWMVRTGSPVDLGLWDWYPASELLMPLDTHVVAVARDFGLLTARSAVDLKQAIRLTELMMEIFPKDPVKGDFALFGHGIENQ